MRLILLSALLAALLGGGIVSRVRAGENSGRTLRHEFVALALETARLESGRARVLLPSAGRDGVTRSALTGWVTRRGDPTPLQATGGWLD
jgi:type II secretory pathway pseudopilin PulG